jgi:hypothetical protein
MLSVDLVPGEFAAGGVCDVGAGVGVPVDASPAIGRLCDQDPDALGECRVPRLGGDDLGEFPDDAQLLVAVEQRGWPRSHMDKRQEIMITEFFGRCSSKVQQSRRPSLTRRRAGKASDVHQRQSMTFMRLVHTEEVTAFRLFDPCLPSEG